MKKLKLSILLISLLWSCGKLFKTPQWDWNYKGPLIEGNLSLNDIIPDSLRSEQNGLLWFDYTSKWFTIDPDQVFIIPDTTISNDLTFPFNFNAQPGQKFYDDGISEIDINGGGAQLTYASFKSGYLVARIYHNIPEPVRLVCKVPGVFDTNGEPFETSAIVQPTFDINIPSEVRVDLSGFTSSLKGVNNDSYNKFRYNIIAFLAENANPATITSGSTITVSGTFEDLKIASAEGYFGQNANTISEQDLPLEFLERIVSGGIDIDSAVLDLKIDNYIGADIGFKLNQLSTDKNGTVLNLTHGPLYQNQWVNRATRHTGVVTPQSVNFHLDHLNSNITEFIELLPENISIDAQVELNPLGNISMWNDFVYTNQTIDFEGSLKFPLNIDFQSIVMSDTLDFDPGNINFAVFTLNAENQFPIDLNLSIGVLSNGSISWLPSTQELVTANNSATLSYELNAAMVEALQQSKKLVIQSTMNTPLGKVNLSPSNQLYYQLTTQANLTLNGQQN